MILTPQKISTTLFIVSCSPEEQQSLEIMLQLAGVSLRAQHPRTAIQIWSRAYFIKATHYC